jgi:hypothetical protein
MAFFLDAAFFTAVIIIDFKSITKIDTCLSFAQII